MVKRHKKKTHEPTSDSVSIRTDVCEFKAVVSLFNEFETCELLPLLDAAMF